MVEDVTAERPPSDEEGPLRQCVQLRAALDLVERMAGDAPATESGDDDARALAYRRATPLARRRFAAAAQEAGTFAAAGIAALIRHRTATGRDCAAAAERLAAEMRQALLTMDRLVPPH